MKTEHQEKEEMVEDMLNDITDVTACAFLSTETLRRVCDDLIRKGWRKA